MPAKVLKKVGYCSPRISSTGTVFMAIFTLCRQKLPAIFIFLSAIIFAGNCVAKLATHDSELLKQTSIEIVNQLKLHHYRYLSIDNDFSSALFDKYLEQLDPAKVYLKEADVKALGKYRYALDNALNKGHLKPALEIYNRYHERLETRLHWLLEQLAQDEAILDFTRGFTLSSGKLSRTFLSGRTFPSWNRRSASSFHGRR